MIVLSDTTQSVVATLGVATTTNPVEIATAYVDLPAHTPAGENLTKSTTTAATVVAAPGASVQRVVDHLSLCNTDTASCTATFFHRTSATDRRLWRGTLAANESVVYTGDRGWRTFSATGEAKRNMPLGASDINTHLGSDLAFWFRANQGITLSGSNVESWADITGNITLAPGDANRFTYEATGFNGQPSILSTATAFLTGTLSSTIASGTRSWMWAVAQYTSLTDAYICSLHSTGDTRWVALGEFSGDWEGCHFGTGAASFTSFTTSVSDTSRHLFEGGFPVGGTNGFFVSNVGTNTPETDAPDAALTTLRLNRMNATITSVPGGLFRIAEIFGSRAIPSSGTRASIISTLQARYGTL